MSDDKPQKIVVEIVSSADVMRLEARDEELRKEIHRLDAKIEGLHRSMYELMEALSNLRSKR